MRSVLLVCDLHPQKVGMFERYLALLGRRCGASGVRCGLLLPSEPIAAVAELLRAAGLEWRVAAEWKDERDRERRRQFLRGYAQALRDGPWDAAVFQFCNEMSVSAATLLARVRGRAPRATVWVQHSQMVPPGRAARWVSKMRVLRQFVDGMIVLSEATREAVCARGWPAARVALIRNGIALPPAPRRGWLRADLGLPPEAVLLVSVGSLITRKGFELLLAAAAPHLGSGGEGPPRHLLIVGDGPERAALQAQSDSLGVSEFVHFLGLRNDVPDLLADSDAFLLASRAEGLTLAVLEGMAAGLPVVVTDVGGHKEVVGPATGWVVPPNDAPAFGVALGEALANPAAARERGATGRRLIETEFSLDAQVEAQYRYIDAVWRSRTGGSERATSTKPEKLQ
jgi:glycosyltransferase involved in cell wall biosynthesis